MRGSLSSSTASASTARTDSLTRRMRSVIERHHVPLAAHEHELLAVEPARGLVEEPLDLALLARDDGRRQARALPQLVVVDLRDGRAEPVLELRLRRLHELALSLQRARLREVQLDGEGRELAGAHAGIAAAAGARPTKTSRPPAPARSDPCARPRGSRTPRRRRPRAGR